MRKVRIKKGTENLISQTFVKATLERKQCPFLRIDRISPYCVKGLNREEEISDERRKACEYSSMMARCLDTAKYQGCIFYTGEEVLE